MEKYFTIIYELEGGKKTDTVDFFAVSKEDAVDKFLNHNFVGKNYIIRYTKYAIIEVIG